MRVALALTLLAVSCATVALTEAAAAQRSSGALDASVPLGASFPLLELGVSLGQTRSAYAHGGFMGFGAEFISNSKWMGILSTLMPQVATEIVKRDALGAIKGLVRVMFVCCGAIGLCSERDVM
jgi:hypothetical protein